MGGILFWPFLRRLDAFLVAGVVAEPQAHLIFAPTAEEIVKPSPAPVAAGQKRRLAQTAAPEFCVKLLVVQVVGVLHIEAAQGKVVQ